MVIRWNNVPINSGERSAALGNTAANFGSNAQTGFAILNRQLADAEALEDSRLTNEAINSALSGGPATSSNRRVDALNLQNAVEKQALGQRAEETLDDNLLSSAVNRRLGSAQAESAEYQNTIAADKWAHQQKMDSLNAQIAQANLTNDTTRLNMLQGQLAEATRMREGALALSQEINDPNFLNEQADAEFESAWDEQAAQVLADTGQAPTATDKERNKIANRSVYRERWLQDPQQLHSLASKYGLTRLEAEARVGLFRDSREAQAALYEAQAAETVRSDKERAKIRTSLEDLTKTGNTKDLIFDGTGFAMGDSGAVTTEVKRDLFDSLRLNPDDADSIKLHDAVKSAFPQRSMYEHAIRQIVGDTEDVPKMSVVREGLADLKAQATTWAGNKMKGPDLLPVAASTEDAVHNWFNAWVANNVKVTPATGEQDLQQLSQDMTTAREFLAAIPGENTNWRTSDVTPGEAKGMLETAVEGFKAQQDNITLPEDASRELQRAFNRYKTAVNVADGGDYIPSSPVTPGRVPGTFRMEKPSFNVRKAHAEKAAGLLQELLAMMKAESEAAFNKSQSALLEEG